MPKIVELRQDLHEYLDAHGLTKKWQKAKSLFERDPFRVLQRDGIDKPIHVVWGIPRYATSPAVLVTAYRPDPERWSDDFSRRKV